MFMKKSFKKRAAALLTAAMVSSTGFSALAEVGPMAGPAVPTSTATSTVTGSSTTQTVDTTQTTTQAGAQAQATGTEATALQGPVPECMELHQAHEREAHLHVLRLQ